METANSAGISRHNNVGNEASCEENKHDAENKDTDKNANECVEENRNELESHVFTVKKITDSRLAKNGQRFYKVQWADSWEPEHNLYGCMELVSEYWERINIKDYEDFISNRYELHKRRRRGRVCPRRTQLTPPKRSKRKRLKSDTSDSNNTSENDDSDEPSTSILHSPQVVVKKLSNRKILTQNGKVRRKIIEEDEDDDFDANANILCKESTSKSPEPSLEPCNPINIVASESSSVLPVCTCHSNAPSENITSISSGNSGDLSAVASNEPMIKHSIKIVNAESSDTSVLPVCSCPSNIPLESAPSISSCTTGDFSSVTSNEIVETKPLVSLTTCASNSNSWGRLNSGTSLHSQTIVVGDSDEESSLPATVAIKEEPVSECEESEKEELFKRTAKLKASFVIKKMCETGEVLSSDDDNASNSDDYYPDSYDSAYENKKRPLAESHHGDDRRKYSGARKLERKTAKSIKSDPCSPVDTHENYRGTSDPHLISTSQPILSTFAFNKSQLPTSLPNQPNADHTSESLIDRNPGQYNLGAAYQNYFLQNKDFTQHYRPFWCRNRLPIAQQPVNPCNPTHPNGNRLPSERSFPFQTLPQLNSLKQVNDDSRFNQPPQTREGANVCLKDERSSATGNGSSFPNPSSSSIPLPDLQDINQIVSLPPLVSPLSPQPTRHTLHARTPTSSYIPSALSKRIVIPMRCSVPIKWLPKSYIEAMIARILYHVRNVIEMLRIEVKQLTNHIQGLIAKGVVLTIKESYLLDYPEPNFIETQVNSLLAIALKELPCKRLMEFLFNCNVPSKSQTKQGGMSSSLPPPYISNPVSALGTETRPSNISTTNPYIRPFTVPRRGLPPPYFANHVPFDQYKQRFRFHPHRGGHPNITFPMSSPVTHPFFSDVRPHESAVTLDHLNEHLRANTVNSHSACASINVPATHVTYSNMNQTAESGYAISSNATNETHTNESTNLNSNMARSTVYEAPPLTASCTNGSVTSIQMSSLSTLSSAAIESDPSEERNAAPCIVTDVRSLRGGASDIEPLVQCINIHDEELLLNGDMKSASISPNSVSVVVNPPSVAMNSYEALFSRPTDTIAPFSILPELLKQRNNLTNQGQLAKRTNERIRYKDLVKQKYNSQPAGKVHNVVDLTEPEGNPVSAGTDKCEPSG